MKKDITHLFYFVSNFIDDYQKAMRPKAVGGIFLRRPTRLPILSDAEIVTIILLFQESPAKNFKYFYQSYLQNYMDNEFKYLPTYERFIILMQRAFAILIAVLSSVLKPKEGVGYIDSTSLAVCHPKRIRSNKVFKDFAKVGKNTKGWFFGMKMHLIISDKGELVNVSITPGDVDDRNPVQY